MPLPGETQARRDESIIRRTRGSNALAWSEESRQASEFLMLAVRQAAGGLIRVAGRLEIPWWTPLRVLPGLVRSPLSDRANVVRPLRRSGPKGWSQPYGDSKEAPLVARGAEPTTNHITTSPKKSSPFGPSLAFAFAAFKDLWAPYGKGIALVRQCQTNPGP